MKLIWAVFVSIPVFAAVTVPGRYLVELSTEPVAVHAARSGGRRALMAGAGRSHRALVRAQQDAAGERFRRRGARVLDRVDTVANVLVLEASEQQIEALKQDSEVLAVHPVRQFRLLLDHALPIHRVIDAWNTVGIDNAGAGIKIGIIDSGVDTSHPGFQDPSLAVPDGFPKANTDEDLAFTNNKVIVARSYVNMLSKPDPDVSPRDHLGHGTATAMVAAGVANAGPLATITGVAPKAWIGSYKVFGSPGVNDLGSEDAVLKAIDDAVKDGMDVLNLSLGSDVASRPENDLEVQALERAASVGVVVVAAAGNAGPDPATIASPANGPSVIAVGASANNRQFAATASVDNGSQLLALAGTGPKPDVPIAAPIVDLAAIDSTALACAALPADSLAGRIALILRGVCTFEDKLNNAQAAGALAALIYTDKDRPSPITMAAGSATLPALMIGYQDGINLKQQLGAGSQAVLQFTSTAVSVSADALADFSAKGPNLDSAIKPDLVAVGTNIYTAAETIDPEGIIYNTSGYSVEQGTSFSAPLVAGAAALLKAARPGLTAADYRSLLINSSAPLSLGDGFARAQQAGTGRLDVLASLNATAAMYPASVSFGVDAGGATVSRQLNITNTGAKDTTYLLSVVPRDGSPAPVLPAARVALPARGTTNLPVQLATAGLGPGQYEGYISIVDGNTNAESRVPYWYAVPSGVPTYVTVLYTDDAPQAGASVSNAIIFHVSDSSGILLPGQRADVTVASGDAQLTGLRSLDAVAPGAWGIGVRFPRTGGTSVIRIQAGDAVQTVTLIAK